jgi:hypothetical protein
MLFTQSNQTINLQTVMATTGPFQRIQAVSPPLKGSFPLDHDSECRSGDNFIIVFESKQHYFRNVQLYEVLKRETGTESGMQTAC